MTSGPRNLTISTDPLVAAEQNSENARDVLERLDEHEAKLTGSVAILQFYSSSLSTSPASLYFAGSASISGTEWRTPVGKGVVRKLRVAITTRGSDATDTMTFTVRKNSVHTSLVIANVAANAASASNLSDSFETAEGDYISIEVTKTGTFTTDPQIVGATLEFVTPME